MGHPPERGGLDSGQGSRCPEAYRYLLERKGHWTCSAVHRSRVPLILHHKRANLRPDSLREWAWHCCSRRCGKILIRRGGQNSPSNHRLRTIPVKKGSGSE
jgi:hypothetical protein